MLRGFYFEPFELVEIDEYHNKGGDNKLILKIKERRIINNLSSKFTSPTITSLLINFGTTGAGMHAYATKLQVGKQCRFNGRLEDAKILVGKFGNTLDINDIPKIQVFKEEPEIITHEPIVPNNNRPASFAIKEKLLRNLDKISFDQAAHLANAELLKNPQN